MPVHVMVRAEPGVCKPSPPFAQLLHDIAADPRLTPVDVRVVAALLFWARDKAVAWPCDRSIASRVGRSVQTVQRSLKRLQALGLIRREKVEPSDLNRTGRVIHLIWRAAHPRATPRSLVSGGGPLTNERRMGETGREKERQPSDSGHEGPPPTGGDGGGDTPASPEDIALWIRWAEGPDALLAKIGRSGLADAGVMPDAIGVLSGQREATPLPSVDVGLAGGVGPDRAVIGDLPVEDAGDVLADRPVAASEPRPRYGRMNGWTDGCEPSVHPEHSRPMRGRPCLAMILRHAPHVWQSSRSPTSTTTRGFETASAIGARNAHSPTGDGTATRVSPAQSDAQTAELTSLLPISGRTISIPADETRPVNSAPTASMKSLASAPNAGRSNLWTSSLKPRTAATEGPARAGIAAASTSSRTPRPKRAGRAAKGISGKASSNVSTG